MLRYKYPELFRASRRQRASAFVFFLAGTIVGALIVTVMA